MNYENRLPVKCAARNHVNAVAIQVAPKFLEVVKTFLGQKIVNADGHLSKVFTNAVAHLFPSLRSTSFTAWLEASYSLRLHLKNYETTSEGFAFYQEQTVYLGDLDGGVLTKLYDLPTGLRVDFTADEIRAAREDVKNARNALYEAEAKLSNFGEHDN